MLEARAIRAQSSVMRRGVTGIMVLLTLVATGAASAAYPGKNGKLLFVRNDPRITDMDSNPNEIWTADPSGARQARLTIVDTDAGAYGVDSARWSPDGSLIAYATDCGNRYSTTCGVLRTMRADGRGKRTIDLPVDPSNHSVGRDRFPTWSPDGTKIAFQRTWPTPNSIWTVDSGGGGAAQLVPQMLSEPAWSPDGTRIAFSRDTTLATVKLDGSDEHVLVKGALPNRAGPDWSPDGTSIAFMEVRRQVIWLCMVSVASGEVRCLTRGGEGAWSPDGKQLVYVHAHDIWTIRADGTHRHNVTRTPNRWESNPDWQPR